MQHVTDPESAASVFSSDHRQEPVNMSIETASHSSLSSPKSTKTSQEPNISQTSVSTLPATRVHEFTPPSSIASSQEQNDVETQLAEEPRRGEQATTSSTVAGKKRTANGHIKHSRESVNGHSNENEQKILSKSGDCASGNGTKLAEELRTKLTYAMIKVQNGWQKHSIDEIESLASQSPRSTLSGFATKDGSTVLSPVSPLVANGAASNSTPPGSIALSAPPSEPSIVGLADTNSKKVLAPPASIVPGSRRRPTPNMNLQINSSLKSSSRVARPTTNQRTPSQNAAMEADAVETLMFMSASPNNSGHFPSHLSAYSPTSQVFSTQTSPLKSQFSPYESRFPAGGSAFSPQSSYARRKEETKTALIDRLLNDLDDDESEELDRAVQIMERYRAAKLSA